MNSFLKKSWCRGFLVLEAIIALALFSICIFSTVTLSWSARRMFVEAQEKEALLNALAPIAIDPLGFDALAAHSPYGNDATFLTFSTTTGIRSISSTSLQGYFASSSISFDFIEPDTFAAYGKDTCPTILAFSNVTASSTSVALPISSANLITDLSVKDGFVYVSTNSSKAADPDLFVFDMKDVAHPMLVSSLNTGPGIAALAIAGPYIFAANESSVDQFDVIDIHDRAHPFVVAQEKVPLDVASSSAPYASAIFYDKGVIYLGTEKGDSPELTVWNVANPANPMLAGRYEVGNKIESIVVSDGRAYIASSGVNQLLAFDVTDPTHLAFIATSAPPGWQTQSGQALDLFEGSLVLGRDTGGFNNTANPEFILDDASSLAVSSSFDEPGGVYGIIARPPYFLVLTRRSSSQFRLDDRHGSTSVAYDIPGIPAALSCDWGNVYIASNNGPTVTLIKNFHE
ncbi:MAG: hypothetical protein P4L61_04315 [Candidatus Pacebacteria bacterium]|nr:hypothetical protein [Candidatus Paceibacterota bacterium]